MALDLAGNNITNVSDLSTNTISKPISPDVFANGRAIVLSAEPKTSPDTSAGKAAPVPITMDPIQIAPSTFAQNGVVYYSSDSTGKALIKSSELNDMGQYGPLPHEPPFNGKYNPVVDCGIFKDSGTGLETSDYNLQISRYFNLRYLCPRENIVAQRGRTSSQIACSLKDLASKILDPIYDHYKFIVSSGFRSVENNSSTTSTSGQSASTTSDHCIGCAADIQLMGTNGSDYSQNVNMFKWIINNGIPFSQLIIYDDQTGKTGRLVHIAFNGKIINSTVRICYAPVGGGYIYGGQNGESLPANLRP